MIALLLLLVSQDSLYARADSLITAHNLPAARRIAEALVSAHPSDVAAHLLLGRILYAWPVAGRYPALAEFREAARLSKDAEGYAWYDSALDAAALDSTDALWQQVRAIASPAEVARAESRQPEDRQQFFATF